MVQTNVDTWAPEPYFWLSVYCWSSSFQTVGILRGGHEPTPFNVWYTFVDAWARHFGYPDVLLFGESEPFEGFFYQQANKEGVCMLQCLSELAWEYGRVKQAALHWKAQFHTAIRQWVDLDYMEWKMLGE